MKKTIYTAYAQNNDITFILCDTCDNGEVISTELIGWYYGEPDDHATKLFSGKLKATYWAEG